MIFHYGIICFTELYKGPMSRKVSFNENVEIRYIPSDSDYMSYNSGIDLKSLFLVIAFIFLVMLTMTNFPDKEGCVKKMGD